MRVAIDTNVLIAALTKPRGTSARIVAAWLEGELEAVASEATLREAELVLGGWLARLAGRERVDALLDALRTRTILVVPKDRVEDLPLKDPGDARMLEAALEGGASHIVTTDREFLSHRGYGAVEFVTPAEFWWAWQAQRNAGSTGDVVKLACRRESR